MKNASLHRFGDRAALSLPGKGETVYLTAKEARALARALNACARSIKVESFVNSNVGTVEVVLARPACTD